MTEQGINELAAQALRISHTGNRTIGHAHEECQPDKNPGTGNVHILAGADLRSISAARRMRGRGRCVVSAGMCHA